MESLVHSEVGRGLVETGHNAGRQDIPEDEVAGPEELLHLVLADVDVGWRSVRRLRVLCPAITTMDGCWIFFQDNFIFHQ